MVKTNFYSSLNPEVVQALNNLQYSYSDETSEMWCSHIRCPFKKLLKYNSKYFSKNGFIQMIERVYIDGKFNTGRRSFHIYCTVCDSLVIIRENTIECANDHLKNCITETTNMHSNPVRKNVKKDGKILMLSSDEIEEIYRKYYFIYSK
ncbi:6212_t:CDS:1, partial [Dentiscutata erythropus]